MLNIKPTGKLNYNVQLAISERGKLIDIGQYGPQLIVLDFKNSIEWHKIDEFMPDVPDWVFVIGGGQTTPAAYKRELTKQAWKALWSSYRKYIREINQGTGYEEAPCPNDHFYNTQNIR